MRGGKAGASFDVEGITPIVVPTEDFYRIDTALITPRVNVDDWTMVFENFDSACDPLCPGDVNGDGWVDVSDLVVVTVPRAPIIQVREILNPSYANSTPAGSRRLGGGTRLRVPE